MHQAEGDLQLSPVPPMLITIATVFQPLASPPDFCCHLPRHEAGRDDQDEGQPGL